METKRLKITGKKGYQLSWGGQGAAPFWRTWWPEQTSAPHHCRLHPPHPQPRTNSPSSGSRPPSCKNMFSYLEMQKLTCRTDWKQELWLVRGQTSECPQGRSHWTSASDGSLWMAFQGSPPSGACRAQNPCPTSGRPRPAQSTAVYSSQPKAHLPWALFHTEVVQFCLLRLWRHTDEWVVTEVHQTGRVKGATWPSTTTLM